MEQTTSHMQAEDLSSPSTMQWFVSQEALVLNSLSWYLGALMNDYIYEAFCIATKDYVIDVDLHN